MKQMMLEWIMVFEGFLILYDLIYIVSVRSVGVKSQ